MCLTQWLESYNLILEFVTSRDFCPSWAGRRGKMKRIRRVPELPDTSMSFVRLSKMLDMTFDALRVMIYVWRLPEEKLNGQRALSANNAHTVLIFCASCSKTEAAKALKVKTGTVQKMYERGDLNGYKFRKRLRIFYESLDQLKKAGVFDESVINPTAHGFACRTKEYVQACSAKGLVSQVKTGRVGHRWTKKEVRAIRLKRFSN